MARDECRRARESQVCHHRIVLCRHFYPPAGEGLVWEATAPSRLFPQFWERVGEAGAQQREARRRSDQYRWTDVAAGTGGGVTTDATAISTGGAGVGAGGGEGGKGGGGATVAVTVSAGGKMTWTGGAITVSTGAGGGGGGGGGGVGGGTAATGSATGSGSVITVMTGRVSTGGRTTGATSGGGGGEEAGAPTTCGGNNLISSFSRNSAVILSSELDGTLAWQCPVPWLWQGLPCFRCQASLLNRKCERAYSSVSQLAHNVFMVQHANIVGHPFIWSRDFFVLGRWSRRRPLAAPLSRRMPQT